MREFYMMHKGKIDKILFITLFIAALYLFFNTIFSYVAPFVIGLLLSLLLFPLSKAIAKYLHLGRGFSALISIIILVCVIGLLSNLLFSRIIHEGRLFFESLPDTIKYVDKTIGEFNERFSDLYALVPAGFENYISDIADNLVSSLTSTLGSGLKTGSTAIVSKIPNFIFGFFLSLLSCFFFIKDRELILKSIKGIIPESLKGYFKLMKDGIIDAVLGYIKAQLIMMSIIAVICMTGLFILKVEYALFLSILIAFVDALPIFGSGFFYWPWIGFSLITGDYSMAIGLGVTYLCVLFTRQALEPKVLGTQIGIHPLITLMSIYVGLRIFGVFGIFIGPFIAVIIKTIATTPVVRNPKFFRR